MVAAMPFEYDRGALFEQLAALIHAWVLRSSLKTSCCLVGATCLLTTLSASLTTGPRMKNHRSVGLGMIQCSFLPLPISMSPTS